MECLFVPHLEENLREIALPETERRHLRALHLKDGDGVMLTNGRGLSAVAAISGATKNNAYAVVTEFFYEMNETSQHISLGIGALDSRDRFEFVLEKAVELGAKEIIPLIADFSQKKLPNPERMIAKSIAALKQCKRSRLIGIRTPVKIDEALSMQWDKIILADENGQKNPRFASAERILILCGPEGGFSDKELAMIRGNKNVVELKLSSARLRAETAAIAALSVAVFNLPDR